jgi:hypothetical protein
VGERFKDMNASLGRQHHPLVCHIHRRFVIQGFVFANKSGRFQALLFQSGVYAADDTDKTYALIT